jgi:hypothetical protein
MRSFLVLIVASAIACALSAPSSAQTRFAVGELHLGIGVEEAIAALPNAQWKLMRRRDSNLIVGGRAPQAVTYLGQTWDVEIGDVFVRSELKTNFDLVLKHEQGQLGRKACYTQFEAIVKALEPVVGAFGGYKGFEDPRSQLYGDPYGPGMRLREVGSFSRMRTWPHPQIEMAYTFREADRVLPYVFSVGLEYVPKDQVCGLKIRVSENDLDRARRAASPEALPLAAPRYNPAEERDSLGRLAQPSSLTRASILEHRHELARWRDVEFTRFGDPGAFQGFSGYFAVLGDRHNPGGIVRGQWRPQASGELAGAYVVPYSVCSVLRGLTSINLDEIVYLGPAWRPEFAALDRELGGDAELRNLNGRKMPEGASPPARQSPLTSDDISRYYPELALRGGVEGSASLVCRVESDLRLRCAVTAEAPEGSRFGQAALRVVEGSFGRVAPVLADGSSSVGLCIPRRINFRMG